MILGHIAVAGIAKQTVFRKRGLSFLCAAALLPDLIDKPPSMLFDSPGRGVGHTLILFVAVCLLAWYFSPRIGLKSDVVVAGLVMWFAHLAGDFLEWGVLLWPFFTAGLEPTPKFDFWDKLYQFYVVRLWPEQFWLEVCCVTAVLGILAVRYLLPVGLTGIRLARGRSLPALRRR